MWLESHANLARHPKTRRLMKLLGWSLPDTIGNLHLFWWWALDFAPTGDLTRYTPEELTADLDLLGSTPDQFIESMIQAGFLDRIEDALCIHDWVDYKRPRPRAPRTFTSRTTSRLGGMGKASAVSEHSGPPARHASYSAAGVVRAVPNVPQTDSVRPAKELPPIISSTPTEEQPVEKQNELPIREDTDSILANQQAALARLNTQPHKLRPSTTGVDSNVAGAPDSQPAVPPQKKPRTAAEDLEHRKTFPPRLLRLPGFIDHWWPLYIDFHKKSGTHLTQEAQTKFLAQLARDPLSAVQQIKAAITQTVRNNFADREGILEHAP